MPEQALTSPIADSSVQYGIVQKPLPGPMIIRFNWPFPVIPVVVISPYLQIDGGQVGEVETITDINHTDFTINSNIDDKVNYFVTWMAIGHPDPDPAGSHL